MPRAVLDSTVLVSAFLTKKGVAADLLNQAIRGAFELYLSDLLINETRQVLLEREHLRKRFTYSDEDVDEFAALLRAFARVVADLPAARGSRDPADDMVLASALAARAEHLVTRDKDLLVLRSYERIAITSPEDFLGLVRRRTRSK
jgi:putative PIN family toxin of toxin-antitoxin system